MAVRDHGLFRRLETPAPDAAQGGCYITHDNGPCVDTGVLVEFEGTLTLSVNTIRELAEVAGFSVNEEAERLEADNAFMQLEIIKHLDTISELRGTIAGFAKAIAEADDTPKAVVK